MIDHEAAAEPKLAGVGALSILPIHEHCGSGYIRLSFSAFGIEARTSTVPPRSQVLSDASGAVQEWWRPVSSYQIELAMSYTVLLTKLGRISNKSHLLIAHHW